MPHFSLRLHLIAVTLLLVRSVTKQDL